MKKKFFKTIVLLIVITLLTGCSSSLKRVDYDELEKMVKDKKSFILLISQDGCSHCEAYAPIIKKVLKENELTAYNLNITYISEEEYNKLKEKYSDFQGTPTTIFIKDGEEQKDARLVGDVSKNKLTSTLKKEKYIK